MGVCSLELKDSLNLSNMRFFYATFVKERTNKSLLVIGKECFLHGFKGLGVAPFKLINTLGILFPAQKSIQYQRSYHKEMF